MENGAANFTLVLPSASFKLAFVRLNRNKNVYRRTAKQPVIDVDSDSSASEQTHQKTRDHLKTPIYRTHKHHQFTVLSIDSDTEYAPQSPSAHKLPSKKTSQVHLVTPILKNHHQSPTNNDSPLQLSRRLSRSSNSLDQKTADQSKSKPAEILKPKLRHRAIFVRTLPHSPVVVIPRISRKKLASQLVPPQSPVQEKPKSSTTNYPSPQINALTIQPPTVPVPRQVRGRMSMVTGSARRSRYLNVLQHQKHTSAPSPLKPHTPQTPRQLITPISAYKLPNHSPLICHHQIGRTTYAHRPINDAIPSLLKICNQTQILNFTTTVENIEKSVVSDRLSNLRTKTKGTWEKIGEATYSEVFCWSPKQLGNLQDRGDPNTKNSLESRIVIKIIPIKRAKKSSFAAQATTSVINLSGNPNLADVDDKSLDNEFPLETDCMDAEKEIKLAKLLGSKSFVVSGEYPRVLLREWDKYRKKFPKQAENPRPGKFSVTQLYCCLLFAHAGKDLEASSLVGWQQAASILEQVSRALSQAEDEYEFEHRDLHWGNLLIHSTEPPRQINPTHQSKTRGKFSDEDVGNLTNSLQGIGLDSRSSTAPDPLKPEASGIGVSIIDYGLSRAKIVNKKSRSAYPHVKRGSTLTVEDDQEILWTDPDDDIFGAVGNDYQFNCYDLVNLTRENKPWSEFNPISNVIWLHYLTKKLIEEKSIATPAHNPTPSATEQDRMKLISTTRVKKTATNAKEKGKQGRHSSNPTIRGYENKARQACVDESNEDHNEKENSKTNIERECYELLVLSQRFLNQLIQLKLQRIHEGKKRDADGYSRNYEANSQPNGRKFRNEYNDYEPRQSTRLPSSSYDFLREGYADNHEQANSQRVNDTNCVDEQREKLALFREALGGATNSTGDKVELTLSMEKTYSLANQLLISQLNSKTKKTKNCRALAA
ncbi:haspin protein kinase [Puccinia sorghi]|uniref:non-specific serine/threonine protein kinase n=1 Tax=Puccinia sorghi TaxID=27349 RepID=A0A0L6UX83_9BASI|nr:haspin protein kinase [Puccinia sorghi]